MSNLPRFVAQEEKSWRDGSTVWTVGRLSKINMFSHIGTYDDPEVAEEIRAVHEKHAAREAT